MHNFGIETNSINKQTKVINADEEEREKIAVAAERKVCKVLNKLSWMICSGFFINTNLHKNVSTYCIISFISSNLLIRTCRINNSFIYLIL